MVFYSLLILHGYPKEQGVMVKLFLHEIARVMGDLSHVVYSLGDEPKAQCLHPPSSEVEIANCKVWVVRV